MSNQYCYHVKRCTKFQKKNSFLKHGMKIQKFDVLPIELHDHLYEQNTKNN